MIYGQPVTFGGASGEISITDNGTFDVKKYASANVNVQSAPVLLWTNASPTSSFAAQGISFATGNYPAVLIELRGVTSEDYRYVNYVLVGETKTVIAHGDNGTYIARRNATVYNGYCQFEGAYFNGFRDDAAIPTRIWALNFTL